MNSRAAALRLHVETALAGRVVAPLEYRNRLRLERARRMLESGGMTVTEICGAVGFESAASFSALFRKVFGVAPSTLRHAGISKIR